MNLKNLIEFCEKNSINTEHVVFWHGWKEVYALFNKGSIPGILYPEDDGWSAWYYDNEEDAYGETLPKELKALGDYVYYSSDFNCYEMRID